MDCSIYQNAAKVAIVNNSITHVDYKYLKSLRKDIFYYP